MPTQIDLNQKSVVVTITDDMPPLHKFLWELQVAMKWTAFDIVSHAYQNKMKGKFDLIDMIPEGALEARGLIESFRSKFGSPQCIFTADYGANAEKSHVLYLFSSELDTLLATSVKESDIGKRDNFHTRVFRQTPEGDQLVFEHVPDTSSHG